MSTRAAPARSTPVQFGRETPYCYDALDEFFEKDYAPEPCRAIHLGCGDGRTAVYIARMGFQVLGIDPDRDLLASARERAIMAELNIDLMGGDPLMLPPLPEESFGLAVDLWTAAEIPDGAERVDFLRSLHKLLRRDGVLISSAPAPKPRRGTKRKKTKARAPFAFASPFISDFTRAGFRVVFEGVRQSPPGEPRLLVHALRDD